MFACVCRGVNESQVKEAGRAGITSPEALIAALALDDEACCGRCAEEIEEFVELALEGAAEAKHPHVVPIAATVVPS